MAESSEMLEQELFKIVWVQILLQHYMIQHFGSQTNYHILEHIILTDQLHY